MATERLGLRVSGDAYVRLSVHALMRRCSISELVEQYAKTLNEYRVVGGDLREEQGGAIYFIQDPSTSHIKIGYSKDVAKRLKELQTANSGNLELLGSISGTVAEEREIHRRFDDCRVNGEWFRPDPELLEFVDDVVGRTECE